MVILDREPKTSQVHSPRLRGRFWGRSRDVSHSGGTNWNSAHVEQETHPKAYAALAATLILLGIPAYFFLGPAAGVFAAIFAGASAIVAYKDARAERR